MGSSFSRIQALILMFVTTTIGILSIIGLISSIIPFFACLFLMFLMGNVIMPIIDGKRAKKAYDTSIEDTSSTIIKIKRNDLKKETNNIDINLSVDRTKKFYPRHPVYGLIILNGFFIFLTIILLAISLLKYIEIDSEAILFLCIAEIAMIIFSYMFIHNILKYNQIVMSDITLRTFTRPNLDLFNKGEVETILYTDIIEVYIKKNKYINYKNKGIVFEFVLNNDSKRIFLASFLSDKQRLEIIDILKEKIR